MSTELVVKDVRRGLPSASALERYFACPGSFLLSKNVAPEEIPESEDAKMGQRVHAAREAGDVTNMDMDEADLVAQMVLDEEAIFHRWCDDYQITDAEVFQERREWLMDNHRRLCSAQIDLYALSRGKRMALVLDRKSGRKGVQPPTRNWQLKGSLVILASLYSLVGGRVAIIQPFARRQVPCDYGPDDIYAENGAWNQLQILLTRISNPKAQRVTGPQCEHCPAKAICPEAQALTKAVEMMKGMSWSTLKPEIKLELWERCRIVQDIIDQVNHIIRNDVRAGLIPGLAMSKDTHPRLIESATKLASAFSVIFPGEDLREVFDNMTKASVGSLEEYVRTRNGWTKAATTEWVNHNLGEIITTTTREGHVVREKK